MKPWDDMTAAEQMEELNQQSTQLNETVRFAGPVEKWEDHPETGFGEDEPIDQQPLADSETLAVWQSEVASGETGLGFEEWQAQVQEFATWQAAVASGETELGFEEWQQ